MQIVTAAIVRDQNKVLLARRRKGQHLEGFWEFPGGKIEQGETPQSCLEREMLEEFNVKVKTGKIVAESTYTYSHGAINLIAIETVLLDGNMQLTVHDRIEWVLLESICDFKLAPADILIAEQLKNGV